MNIRKFNICFGLLIIIGLLLSSTCFAAIGEVIDVERHVPENTSDGEITEITLSIAGEKPFMIGIVETIPQGFTFPQKDEDVSDSEYFRLDRDAGKITFAVKDKSEVKYNVIAAGIDEKIFKGYWVDMLYQSPELNQGKNMWKNVTDPNVVLNAQDSGTTYGSETADNTNSKGIFIIIGLIILVAVFLVWKKYFSGGDKR